MVKLNPHYAKLKAGYLFPEIARRTAKFREANPKADIIRLGIGDVTQPLPPSIIKAFHQGVEEMGDAKTFRGYGPEQGYPFLIDKIIEHDFASRGAHVEADEVFVSDGSKCDTGNIQEIFAIENVIAVQDPVYPVYVDTNIMAGRDSIVLLPCTAKNDFRPELPKEKVDIIYLCSPNNPTGSVLSREDLAIWVRFAKENNAIIFFDAAYEAYIHDPKIPHSIYEIEGARDVAIEFRSFSKNAGFTGVRCAFTVVPKSIMDGKPNAMWNRRHCTKFNGVSYPVQKAAEAVYSDAGKSELAQIVSYYMENAKIIRSGLTSIGISVYGGVNAPYIWLKVPGTMDSWTFFDKLLTDVNVVGTPGSGFGPAGEGYFRLSAFGDRDRVREAVDRITRAKLT